MKTKQISMAAAVLVSASPLAIALALTARPVLLALAVALSVSLALISLAILGPQHAFRSAGCTVAALAVACFAVTMAQELILGGTPLNGKVTEEGYYVGSHGTYHQVPPLTYRLGMVFDFTLVALWPAMFVFAMLMGVFNFAKKAKPGRWKPAA